MVYQRLPGIGIVHFERSLLLLGYHVEPPARRPDHQVAPDPEHLLVFSVSVLICMLVAYGQWPMQCAVVFMSLTWHAGNLQSYSFNR